MRRPVAVRVVGPLQWIVYPSLMALLATLVLATPVTLFGIGLPEPVIPMVLAFAWPLIRPSISAPLALAVLGLILDVLWYAPLGLWGLVLLCIYAAILVSRNFLMGQETRVLFVWYTVAVLGAFFLAWVIITIDAGRAPSLLALMGQIVPTLLIFPLADRLIQRFDDGDVRFR